jgi:hypothetical protein
MQDRERVNGAGWHALRDEGRGESTNHALRRDQGVPPFGVPPLSKVAKGAAMLILLAAVSLARAEPPVAVPIDGEAFPAELAAADADWQLTFTSGQARRGLSAADLVRWGACDEPRRGPAIVLADGGLLLTQLPTVDKQNLAAESDLFGRVQLPLEQVAGLVLQLPGDRPRRESLLDRVADAAGESDRVLLLNGDELAGSVTGVGADAIRLDTATGPLAIGMDRAAAVVFNPALRRPAAARGLRAWVGLADGSLLLAAKLVREPGAKTAKITLASGQEWTTAAENVVFLQPLGGRAVYLGDLRPAEFRHIPFLDLPWPYHADRSVTGGRLRSGGRLYLKGLGVHSSARLTYLLDEPYGRFDAELGIDDSTDGGGSVRYRVYVDRQTKFTSEILRGGMKPVPVSVDLTGAKRLDLVIDFADRADELDHADWLDARLVRPEKQATAEEKK